MLNESLDGAVRLVFDHDEDGTVTCTTQATVKADPQHEPDERRTCWQPPPIMTSVPGPEHNKSVSGSSSTRAQDTSQSADVELSMDLASLPKRDGGDLELTFCIQGEVSRLNSVTYINKTDAIFLSPPPLFSLIS